MDNDYIELIFKQKNEIDKLNKNLMELVITNQRYLNYLNQLTCRLDTYIDREDNNNDDKIDICIDKLEKIREFYFLNKSK